MIPISDEEIRRYEAMILDSMLNYFDAEPRAQGVHEWNDIAHEALIALADGDEFARDEPFPLDPDTARKCLRHYIRQRDEAAIGRMVMDAIRAKATPYARASAEEWAIQEADRREVEANRRMVT